MYVRFAHISIRGPLMAGRPVTPATSGEQPIAPLRSAKHLGCQLTR